MNRKTIQVIGGLRFCMESGDFCDTDCPMYGRCIGKGEDTFAAAAAQLEENARMLDAAMDVIEGVSRRYVYFMKKAPVEEPPVPANGMIAYILHDERRYIPAIDKMAWGTAIFDRLLEPWETERYGLICGPRD